MLLPRDQDGILKDRRLIFYEKDVEEIDKVLEEFLRLAEARCALLIDKEGHLVTRKGATASLDMDTISALVAGSFAATKEMARLLGEEEFSVLFHQGKKDNIQLTLIGERTLLAVIFDDRTTVGMVRLYATEASAKLLKTFERVEKNNTQENVGWPQGAYNKEEGIEQLNKLFGNLCL
jgi:predicted regulator of Ras-like GTPase activity (Roadblock/LC7/MglB family)